jgi:hypothetical protein
MFLEEAEILVKSINPHCDCKQSGKALNIEGQFSFAELQEIAKILNTDQIDDSNAEGCETCGHGAGIIVWDILEEAVICDTENLLILDIDDTLTHTYDSSDRFAIKPKLKHDFVTSNGYKVYKRPYLDQFLNWAFLNFRVGIWSAAGKDYVAEVLKNILKSNHKLQLIRTHEDCTRKYLSTPENRESPKFIEIKRIQKLAKSYNLAKILVLDDRADVHCQNWGNLVKIKPFNPDVEDNELLKVQPFIEEWFKAEDVRKIEKRGWSNHD